MSDWILHKEADLAGLCGRWKISLADTEKVAAYGWDQAAVTKLTGRIDAFLAARAAYETDNSSVNCLTKDNAKKAAIEELRDFARAFIRFNKKMDDAARLALGIRPRDTKRTAHGKPASQPDTAVENTANHFEHRVRALNHENKTASKPADAYGVRYVWQVGGEKPPSGADIRGHSQFTRKTSLTVTHTEADKTRIAYYATCYESQRGEQGSWSPVEEAVIG